MTTETYNGWTNYESWVVALWIDNEESAHINAREIASEHESDMAAGEAIERWLDSQLEDRIPESGLLADLITHAMARVDWREIGAHFRAE